MLVVSLYCDSIAINLYSCCEKGFESFYMQCVMVHCKDGKMEFVFLAKLMRCVTIKKNTVEIGFLKANRQTVHLFQMSNAYQQ